MIEWEYPTNPREAWRLDPEAVHLLSVFPYFRNDFLDSPI